MIETTYASFVQSPVGHYTIIGTSFVWCVSPALTGTVLWGKQSLSETRDILHIYEQAEHTMGPAFGVILDTRGVDEVDPAGLELLFAWIMSHREAIAGRVRMQASVIREGPIGFLLTGLLPVARQTHFYRIFTDPAEAFQAVEGEAGEALLAEVESITERVRNVSRELRMTRELLRSRLDITFDEVSRAIGMSSRSLQRVLQKQDTSFHQEVITVRFALAKELLRSGDAKLAEIAGKLGISERALILLFRAQTGMTPIEWRKKERRLPRSLAACRARSACEFDGSGRTDSASNGWRRGALRTGRPNLDDFALGQARSTYFLPAGRIGYGGGGVFRAPTAAVDTIALVSWGERGRCGNVKTTTRKPTKMIASLKRFSSLALVAGLAAFASACGSSSSSSDSTVDPNVGKGCNTVADCGAGYICQPSVGADSCPFCDVACSGDSDPNCVSACEAMGAGCPTAGPDCTQLCDTAAAFNCGDDQTTCMNTCAGFGDECRQCLADTAALGEDVCQASACMAICTGGGQGGSSSSGTGGTSSSGTGGSGVGDCSTCVSECLMSGAPQSTCTMACAAACGGGIGGTSSGPGAGGSGTSVIGGGGTTSSGVGAGGSGTSTGGSGNGVGAGGSTSAGGAGSVSAVCTMCTSLCAMGGETADQCNAGCAAVCGSTGEGAGGIGNGAGGTTGAAKTTGTCQVAPAPTTGAGGSGATTGPSCSDLCTKYAACTPAAQCAQECPAFSDACRSCINTTSPTTCDASSCMSACTVGQGQGGSSPTADCTVGGATCASFTDCPQSAPACNSKTGRCFNGSTATCIGTPCASFSDCPASETCNSTTGTCN